MLEGCWEGGKGETVRSGLGLAAVLWCFRSCWVAPADCGIDCSRLEIARQRVVTQFQSRLYHYRIHPAPFPHLPLRLADTWRIHPVRRVNNAISILESASCCKRTKQSTTYQLSFSTLSPRNDLSSSMMRAEMAVITGGTPIKVPDLVSGGRTMSTRILLGNGI
jgi:hypothetical protein